MESKGKNKPDVIFQNEPKLSEHEVDAKFNERRKKLLVYVKDFISNHSRFQGKEVRVTFSHAGVSSLVSMIETPEEKLVLKIPLSIYNNGEALFLKAWEQAGVRVPHIVEEGSLDEHSYVLMEYIDAPTLRDVYGKEELIGKETYLEMGHTLRTMHIPEAEGYGKIVDGKAEFPEFKDWLDAEEMQKKFRYINENALLCEDHGSFNLMREILLEHTKDKKSCYCHFDFGSYNIFSTKPIAVFDPNPVFNNGYIDLGRSIVIQIANGSITPEHLIEGYFEGKPYDKKVLQASILLNAYMKFPYWHKKKNIKHPQNVQKYLLQTKYLMGE